MKTDICKCAIIDLCLRLNSPLFRYFPMHSIRTWTLLWCGRLRKRASPSLILSICVNLASVLTNLSTTRPMVVATACFWCVSQFLMLLRAWKKLVPMLKSSYRLPLVKLGIRELCVILSNVSIVVKKIIILLFVHITKVTMSVFWLSSIIKFLSVISS